MKKTKTALSLALLIVFALMLSGCGGKGDEPVTYESASGLTIQMKKGFKESTVEGSTCFFEATDCMMNAIKEDFELFASIGNDAANMSMADYAALVSNVNGVDFVADENNNYNATYENTVDSNDFFYFSTLRRTDDAFWVINFACLVGEKDKFLPLFESWAETISFK
ncbi:MAG: hypothetical protein GX061_02875 [Eubacteriaceae bacterium]|nr:hypothetical protein [Eubacteriaceae bacterium]